jgi:N-acetylmuramoyl-L-alanine amidase
MRRMQTRSVNLIVIHCSATPSGISLHQGERGQLGYLNAAQVINARHAVAGHKRSLEARQRFNGSLPSIGFHFVIDTTGEVFAGRAPDEIGAHAPGFDEQSLGICLVGGEEPEALYTEAQWRSLYQVVTWQAKENRIPLLRPQRISAPNSPRLVAGVCGQRDLSNAITGSPGFDVDAWLRRGLYPMGLHIARTEFA